MPKSISLDHTMENAHEGESPLWDPRGTLTRRRGPSTSSSTGTSPRMSSNSTPTTPIHDGKLAWETANLNRAASLSNRRFDIMGSCEQKQEHVHRSKVHLDLQSISSGEKEKGQLFESIPLPPAQSLDGIPPSHRQDNIATDQSDFEPFERGRQVVRGARSESPALLDFSQSRSRSRSARYGQLQDSQESFTSNSYTDPVPWSPAAEFLSSFAQKTDLAASIISTDAPIEVNGWKLSRTIGIGTFSVVRECQNVDTGEKAAVKVIRVEDDSQFLPSSLSAARARNVSSPLPFSSGGTVSSFALAAEAMELDSPQTPDASGFQSFLQREVSVWSKLPRHINVLPLLGVYSEDFATYVFMPLCDDGNLLEYINNYRTPRGRQEPRKGGRSRGPPPKKSFSSVGIGVPDIKPRGLPASLVRHIFKQIAEGLAHLHSCDVTHRDIKLENILLDGEGFFKIADFGLAFVGSDAFKMIQHERERSEPAPASYDSSISTIHSDAPAGSLNYCSPEQLKSNLPATSSKVDIWALGCVLYALLTGNLPFVDDFAPRLRIKILKASWEVPTILREQQPAYNPVLEVLTGCLEADASQRWDIHQVLNSHWLSASWKEPLLEDIQDEDVFHSASSGSRSSRPTSQTRSRSRGRQLEVSTADLGGLKNGRPSPYPRPPSAGHRRRHSSDESRSRSRSRDSNLRRF